jgi:site-specific DNA-methyltransferase (cytosine-N4-specific)
VAIVATSLGGAPTSHRDQLEARYQSCIVERLELGRQVSYVRNRRVPFLRLYRFKEAFSLRLVDLLLDELGATQQDIVFDPFCGLGTTLFAAMLRGIPSVGVDKLPIASFASHTLPLFFQLRPGALLDTFERLHRTLDRQPPAHVASDVRLMQLAFSAEHLARLRQWKSAVDQLTGPLRDVFLLLFFGSLERVSRTANDGQFHRVRPDKLVLHPDEAMRRKVEQAEQDLASWPLLLPRGGPLLAFPTVIEGDARSLPALPDDLRPTLLVTSPPYPNRYDYTRSYCLELCFHFARDFADLRELRMSILRSHIEAKALPGDEPVHPALAEVVDILGTRRLNNPRIVPMLVAYFVDMAAAIRRWSALLAPGARVAMVVDNVRFDGEMVPTDTILSALAERHGFRVERIEVARYKGNSSQQMGRFGRLRARESVVYWTRPPSR